MIGTPIQGTLWRVGYRYRKAEAPAVEAEPLPTFTPGSLAASIASQARAALGPPQEHQYGGGQIFVVTADVTGSDLVPIVERACLAAGCKGTEFSLCNVERVADMLRGFALLEGGPS